MKLLVILEVLFLFESHDAWYQGIRSGLNSFYSCMHSTLNSSQMFYDSVAQSLWSIVCYVYCIARKFGGELNLAVWRF